MNITEAKQAQTRVGALFAAINHAEEHRDQSLVGFLQGQVQRIAEEATRAMSLLSIEEPARDLVERLALADISFT